MKALIYFGICILIVLVLTTMFAGCAQPTPAPDTQMFNDVVETDNVTKLIDIRNQGVYRVIDDYAGVVCYVYSGMGEESGIDCMPLADTKLYSKPR